MSGKDKKLVKAQAKALKKAAKALKEQLDATGASLETQPPDHKPAEQPTSSSRLVTFAESVRGVLFLIFAVSLGSALLVPGANILSINKLIEELLPLPFGKLMLGLIAIASFIYGLKCLRAIR